MATRRAIFKAESVEKVPEIIENIENFAKTNQISVIVNHIGGNILTLHAPEEHFDEIIKTPGILYHEDAKPVYLLRANPNNKNKPQP